LRRSDGDAAGQAAVELALVLPLLAIFTVLIAQFSIAARDQLALWQSDGVVTVKVVRQTRLTLAGFGFLQRTITLRARVSMALEPPVAFSPDVVGGEFPAQEP
jgi:hypothetical protein